MPARILHAADLHLDSPIRGLAVHNPEVAARIRSATRKTFQRLIDLCLKEEIPLLLLAGDLFDGDWPDFSSGLFLNRELQRLNEVGTKVVLIRGNHDAESRITRKLRWPSHVSVLSHEAPQSVRFEDLSIAVHGQSFAHAAVKEDLAAGYPKPFRDAFNIGLLHTSLNGRPGHAPYAPTTQTVLIDRGYDYWALGHIHKREIVSTAPYIVYPGNLQGRHARETGAKGAYLLTVEGMALQQPPQFCALDTLRFLEFSRRDVAATNPAEAIDGLASAIREAHRRETADDPDRYCIFRIRLSLNAAVARAYRDEAERWRAELLALINPDLLWIESLRCTADAEETDAPEDAWIAKSTEDFDAEAMALAVKKALATLSPATLEDLDRQGLARLAQIAPDEFAAEGGELWPELKAAILDAVNNPPEDFSSR